MTESLIQTSTPTQRAVEPTVTPILNLVGEKVALGPQTKEHVALLTRWVNDFEVALFSGDDLRPTSPGLNEALYEKENKEWQTRRTMFTIFERSTLRPIGMAGWRDIDPVRRTAHYGILIGEKDCWGKGYGTETTQLMLEYAFTALNLHSVQLATYSYNERAIRAYTRAGFREIGRWRESQRLGDRLYDDVYMDCLASEFKRPLKPVLPLP